MDSKQEPRREQPPRTLTASVRPTLSEHLAAKQAKQAMRQRAREDRMMLRAKR